MSKTKIEEIRERTEKNASMRSDDFGHSVQDLLEFESQALQIAADDIAYLLQEIDRLNGKVEKLEGFVDWLKAGFGGMFGHQTVSPQDDAYELIQKKIETLESE